MTKVGFPLFISIAVLTISGCKGGGSPAGKYHIEQDGYVFGSGADKIILNLRSNGAFDVKAGR